MHPPLLFINSSGGSCGTLTKSWDQKRDHRKEILVTIQAGEYVGVPQSGRRNKNAVELEDRPRKGNPTCSHLSFPGHKFFSEGCEKEARAEVFLLTIQTQNFTSSLMFFGEGASSAPFSWPQHIFIVTLLCARYWRYNKILGVPYFWSLLLIRDSLLKESRWLKLLGFVFLGVLHNVIGP